MKKFLYALMILSVSAGASAEMPAGDKQVLYEGTVALNDIPFKGITITNGLECIIFFKDVAISDGIRDIFINIDNVMIRLEDDGRKYTTLNILNLDEGLSVLSSAKKVIIVIRDEADFMLWDKFFQKALKDRDEQRKNFLQPTRVLPPKVLSP